MSAASFENAQPVELINFGAYSQTAMGTDRTPISWVVLENSGSELLVLSRDILDCRRIALDFCGELLTDHTRLVKIERPRYLPQ